MGKTWKNRNNHANCVYKKNGKEIFGRNFRNNSFKRSYSEKFNPDNEIAPMRKASIPPETWQDQETHGLVMPKNVRNDVKNRRKAKKQREKFENENNGFFFPLDYFPE